MKRRQFIQASVGFVGGALLAHSPTFSRPRQAGSKPLKIVVVGGGIVGASIALHLARGGAAVTLLDKLHPTAGATEKSFAWINTVTTDTHYRALRLESLLRYRELDLALGLNITWAGYLNWKVDPAQSVEIREYASALEGTPYALRKLTAAELLGLSPNLTPGPVNDAFFSPIDGHVDPVWATYRFLDHAAALGAQVHYPCEVTDFDIRRGRLAAVMTSSGPIVADRVVLAAGVDTPHLLEKLDFPFQLKHAPGILAHTVATPSLITMVHEAPDDVSFKQMANGRIVATDSPSPPDLAVHQAIRAHPIDFPDDGLRVLHGQRILRHVAQYLPAVRNVPFDHLTLGFRPVPLDELPAVGPLPRSRDVYVVVTHSGVTLAPILGQSVAREILEDRPTDLLAPYRPTRFTSTAPVM